MTSTSTTSSKKRARDLVFENEPDDDEVCFPDTKRITLVTGFLDLPDDVIGIILGSLNLETVLKCRLVCKQLCQSVLNESTFAVQCKVPLKLRNSQRMLPRFPRFKKAVSLFKVVGVDSRHLDRVCVLLAEIPKLSVRFEQIKVECLDLSKLANLRCLSMLKLKTLSTVKWSSTLSLPSSGPGPACEAHDELPFFRAMKYKQCPLFSLSSPLALSHLKILHLSDTLLSSLTDNLLPPSLEGLIIDNCTSLTTVDLRCLPCLTMLVVVSCPVLQSVQLPSANTLSTVEISSCGNLVSIDMSMCSNLQFAQIHHCASLRSLLFPQSSHMQRLVLCCLDLFSLDLRGLVNLTSLRLQECHNLPVVDLYNVSKLVSCHITFCSGMRTLDFSANRQLEQLVVTHCPVTTLSVKKLDKLRNLSVEHLPDLATLDVGDLSSLYGARFVHCHRLSSLLFSTHAHLLNLHIHACALQTIDLTRLTALLTLAVCDCPILTLLNIHSISTLRTIVIKHCNALRSLDLSNLIVLQNVEFNCVNLLGSVTTRNANLRAIAIVKNCPVLRLRHE